VVVTSVVEAVEAVAVEAAVAVMGKLLGFKSYGKNTLSDKSSGKCSFKISRNYKKYIVLNKTKSNKIKPNLFDSEFQHRRVSGRINIIHLYYIICNGNSFRFAWAVYGYGKIISKQIYSRCILFCACRKTCIVIILIHVLQSIKTRTTITEILIRLFIHLNLYTYLF